MIILSILGVIFLIIIYIKLGIYFCERLWYKTGSLECIFYKYLNNPWYGICNITFNLFLWPLGVILNLITIKFCKIK